MADIKEKQPIKEVIKEKPAAVPRELVRQQTTPPKGVG